MTQAFSHSQNLFMQIQHELLKSKSKGIFESYIWKSRQIKNSWKISPFNSTVFWVSCKPVLRLWQFFQNAPRRALGDETKTAVRETIPAYELCTFLCIIAICLSLKYSFTRCTKNKQHSFLFYLEKSRIWGETLGFFPTFTKYKN